MAESPSHRFGQVVGNLLEEILLPELIKFCDGHDLYVDRHGDRVNVRKGRKVSWEDKYGNTHDLDFVIEKGGSPTVRGRPVAFIEAAWRRYSKHSRAKAQEIQGAVLPVSEKYELDAPFLGAVLAGVFTPPSLDQLRSLGFCVVFLPYESIVAAFEHVGIDARFDEATPDPQFRACVDNIEALSKKDRDHVKQAVLGANRAGFDEFFRLLRRKLERIPDRIAVLPLFGDSVDFTTAAEAMHFVMNFDKIIGVGAFRKFEIIVRFSNDDEIRGMFSEESEVINFLRYVAG